MHALPRRRHIRLLLCAGLIAVLSRHFCGVVSSANLLVEGVPESLELATLLLLCLSFLLFLLGRGLRLQLCYFLLLLGCRSCHDLVV